MKYIIITALWSLIFTGACAQGAVWTAYWNADTTLYGFKDPHGKIMIEPRFMGMGIAHQFDRIMAVAENESPGGPWESYYLTKAGRKLGYDSVYFFDNAPDCECEGFIRFQVRRLDKVGLLNGDGKVLIPAVFDYLSRVNNGLLIGLRGAAKKQEGEHFFWEGGVTALLDTTGKILIPSFNPSPGINLYTFEKSPEVQDHPDRIRYRADDGNYYSFVDYEKEFAHWLRRILPTLSADILKQHTFGKLCYYSAKEGWVFRDGETFIDRNYQVLSSRLQQLQQPSCDSFIARNGLNPFIFETREYEKYFDNCRQAREWKYPQMSLYINHNNGKSNARQDGFDFLRTEGGYKLIGVSIKDVTFQ